MNNELLIKKFYDALGRLDYQTMQECYHEDSTFEDPAFGLLTHEETCAMWKMLCKRAKDLSISSSAIHADETKGSGKLTAYYTFSASNRKVENHISSFFEFSENKIIKQKDSFNLWNWSRQAFGPVGFFLGWFPLFQTKIREEALKNLHLFMEKENKLKNEVKEPSKEPHA